MILHPEEFQRAVEYWKDKEFPALSKEQYALITEHGKCMIRFYLRHPYLHHAINLGVFAVIFALDFLVLLRLGAYIDSPLWAGLVVGLLHAYIMYTLSVFSLHEGAAHKLIVLRKGPLSRMLALIADNTGRITFAESDYYAKNHLSHHANFGTLKDDEFLNFIRAKRFYGVFWPYGSIFNFTDFKSQVGMAYTPSRFLSLFLSLFYHAVLAGFMRQYYSWAMIVIALVLVYPNFFFWLDRTRQYMEHNLMPLNVINGARDLGDGFWGMLVGGGPWGQPCHWTHHLVVGVPWYNQLRLHRFIREKVLTPEQKKLFLLRPVVGFPRKLSVILRETSA